MSGDQQRAARMPACLFAVMAILGIVADPTTEGLYDSKRAMSYDEPWHDEVAD